MLSYMQCNSTLNTIWYKKHFISYLLLPFSWCFSLIVFIRRVLYKIGLLKSYSLSAPVVVVGNITVGGTGKTPLVIYLANLLKEKGYRPGVISRGYGGKNNSSVQVVDQYSNANEVGDEPLLIFKRTQCPVYVCQNRVNAAKSLLDNTGCNVIISDDGLQHYALHRDVEIAVIDEIRQLGNGLLLPAGPLRESKARLKSVDFIISNGKDMKLIPDTICSLNNQNNKLTIDSIKDNVRAVAAIGYPQRFFDTLRSLGVEFSEHAFPDHYQFKLSDFNFNKNDMIIMTEKDAVKCFNLNIENAWYLLVTAKLDQTIVESFSAKIDIISKN